MYIQPERSIEIKDPLKKFIECQSDNTSQRTFFCRRMYSPEFVDLLLWTRFIYSSVYWNLFRSDLWRINKTICYFFFNKNIKYLHNKSNVSFLLFQKRLAPYNKLKLLGYYLFVLIVIQNELLMESICIDFVYSWKTS